MASQEVDLEEPDTDLSKERAGGGEAWCPTVELGGLCVYFVGIVHFEDF